MSLRKYICEKHLVKTNEYSTYAKYDNYSLVLDFVSMKHTLECILRNAISNFDKRIRLIFNDIW